MKMLRSLLLLSCLAVFFLACEKEYSLEGGLTPAAGTLKADTFGDCLPSSVKGVYKKDTTLNSTNYIEITVDFTSGGTYTIGSDTLNGYFFLGSGIIAAPGLQTIKLFGVGKPFNAGVDNFTIRYRNTQCFIAVTVAGATGSTAATYTLGATAGACTGATLAGTYKEGLATSATNTATINVNVTALGTYTISSTAVNGVTFAKSGTFTATGAQTVVLQATGTPAAAGTFSYPLTGATSTCAISVTYTSSTTPVAVFTLAGAPNACTSPVVAGTYAVGTAMTSTNTVTIQVNVTTAGTYSLNTNTVNGISFAASGTFPATGAQSITLVGVGTPSAAGTATFTPQAGASACTFPITITATQPTDYLECKLNGVLKTFNVDAFATEDIDTDPMSGVTIASIIIDGFSVTSGAPPYFGVAVAKVSNTAIGTGTYTINQLISSNVYVAAEYDDQTGKQYTIESDAANQTASPVFTVTITSKTATRVTGTFSGPVRDNNGAGPGVITVTEGKFSVPIQ